MSQHIPSREPDRFTNRRKVAGIVLDASRARPGGRLRLTATALVVEDDLPSLGEWGERGPQQVVVEEQTTVDTHERSDAGYFRGEVHGELEPAGTNGAPSEARRSGPRASESDESFSRGDRPEGNGSPKIVIYITYTISRCTVPRRRPGRGASPGVARTRVSGRASAPCMSSKSSSPSFSVAPRSLSSPSALERRTPRSWRSRVPRWPSFRARRPSCSIRSSR